MTENLDSIDEAALLELCGNRTSESTTIDFKATPHDKSDDGKVELAKDVCAFANADGGDLFIGVGSKDYVAAGLAPIKSEAFDALVRRYTETLNAKVEPRIHGIRFREVRLEEGGFAVVVRVPSSYDGPHSVRVSQELRRFVIRNGTSISDMSFDQIRSAFDRTATLSQQASEFIGQRLEAIASRGASTRVLPHVPVWALHVVPLSGIGGRKRADLNAIHENGFLNYLGEDWGGGGRTFNFDGLAIHPGGKNPDGYYAYAHVFRDGTTEFASVGGDRTAVVQGGPVRPIVWGPEMSKFFWKSATVAIAQLRRMDFSGPALLSVALLSARGYELAVGDVFHRVSRGAADRMDLIVSPAWIESLESSDLSDALRPMLDSIWQAFDVPRCQDFDEETGKYKPRRG